MLSGLQDHFRTGNDPDLDVNANLPEVIHGDLIVAEVEALVVLIDGAEASVVRAPRIAGRVQQILGNLGVIAIGPLDLLGPLLEGHEIPEHRFANSANRARIAPTLHVVLGDSLEVYGHAEGLTYPDVVKGRLLVVEIERRLRTIGHRVEHQVGVSLL